jgi:hypothetical protein
MQSRGGKGGKGGVGGSRAVNNDHGLVLGVGGSRRTGSRARPWRAFFLIVIAIAIATWPFIFCANLVSYTSSSFVSSSNSFAFVQYQLDICEILN